MAPAATAATFTRIDLLTSGSGHDFLAGNQSPLRDMTFTYVVPSADNPAVITSTPDRLVFVGDPFLTAPAAVELLATAGNLAFNASATSGFRATACYTAAASHVGRQAALPVSG